MCIRDRIFAEQHFNPANGLRQQLSDHARAGLDAFSWEQSIARTVSLYEIATRRLQEEA